MKRPRLKRDWIGRRVRLLRKMETVGGLMLPTGLVMKLEATWRGRFKLSVVRTCKHCGVGQRSSIARVRESDVELLED